MVNLRQGILIPKKGFTNEEIEAIRNLIKKESFCDCLFFPKSDKKFYVSDVDEIKEESALNPVEADKKLFVIGDFAEVGIAQQNKLLKLSIVFLKSNIKHKIKGISKKYIITPGNIQKNGQNFSCPAYGP